MSVFRKINTSFWQDPFVLELTPEEKYFYLYLMTNTKTSQCGIYEIPKKIIEIETGYNRETIDKLIQRFVEYGKVVYSEGTNEIMLVNWIKYNGSSSPKVLSRVESELKEIKSKELVGKYVELSNGYNYTLDTVSILYPYHIDTQSQEEEEEEEEKEEEKEKDIDKDIIILSNQEEQFIRILEKIDNYPLDRKKDLEMYKTLEGRYPELNLVDAIEDWRLYKLDKPLKSNSNARSQINTSFKFYVKWGKCLKGATDGRKSKQDNAKNKQENEIDWAERAGVKSF